METQSTDNLTIQDLYAKSHAIVIGISEYQEKKWVLPNPKNDAIEMARSLREKHSFDNVELILDKEATKQKLDGMFEDYIRSGDITEKDRLLVYYSGHGDIRPSTDQQGRIFAESYLIPVDAKPNVYSSYINMDTVTNNCVRCKAKHVLLILDSCFSGTAFIVGRGSGEKPKKITDDYLNRISNMRSIQALAATDKVQVALDSGLTSNHGAFTGCLLDILNGDFDPDNDGILTASEVGSYLEKNVPRSGIPQNPVYGHLPGSEVGEFIFNLFKSISGSGTVVDKGTDSHNPPVDIDYLFNLGNARFKEKKFDEALNAYEQILKVEVHNLRALFEKGVVLRELRKFDDSLSSFDEALIVLPRHATTLVQKGNTLLQMGEHYEAWRCFDSALTADRKNKAAKTYREEVEKIMYNPKKALKYWMKLESGTFIGDIEKVDYIDSYRMLVLNNISFLLLRKGEGDMANRYLKEALKLDPDDGYALRTAKNILQWAQNKYDEVKDGNDVGKQVRYESTIQWVREIIPKHLKRGKKKN